MHEGGVDTHASAKAAGDQAQAALDMATAAGDQVDAGNNFSDSAEEINRGVTGAVGQLKAAANNTRAGIDATKESLQLDQRAWVGVDDVSGVPKLDEFVIDVAIKNTGRTPAREVESLNTYTHLERLLIVAGGFYAKDDDPIDFGLIRWRKMIEAWPTLRVSEEK